MKIALFGATSNICKDLIVSFFSKDEVELSLFSRNAKAVRNWLVTNQLSNKSFRTLSYDRFFSTDRYDAIINFVGVGNPEKALQIGSSILEITHHYDQLALEYLAKNPYTKYIFLSSGAAYGQIFDAPAECFSKAQYQLNDLNAQDWYGIAKLYAETKHRSLQALNIIDLRVFNYFSSTIEKSARFFITDILRAIKKEEIFQTTRKNFYRDYLSPADFYMLIKCILATDGRINDVYDCYTSAPIDKLSLLKEMKEYYGLNYQFIDDYTPDINASGLKTHYYSLSRRAESIGYFPPKTSLQNVLMEADKLLGS